jgi:hypothetical protein
MLHAKTLQLIRETMPPLIMGDFMTQENANLIRRSEPKSTGYKSSANPTGQASCSRNERSVAISGSNLSGKTNKEKEAMSDARQVLSLLCPLFSADVPYVDRETPKAPPDTVNA